ncbi:MAG: ribosome recycling factor [Candidatus Margulisiibacteriota bacterium]|jgi:ribosome recycling factor
MDINNELFEKALGRLNSELKTLRSGRATPTLVEGIIINAYNVRTPLKQLATIHTPEPRLIVIEPWDKGLLKDVEKGILEAQINLTPNNDGSVIRIQIPPLTEETRRDIIKLLHQKLEEGRIAIRKIREDVLKGFKKQKEDGVLSEDDFFKYQKHLQDMVDGYNEKIKEIGEQKEQEIMTV